MKPQLEGGGSNIYGKDIAHALKTMSKRELCPHILMERIRPPHTKSYLVRANTGDEQQKAVECVSELGVYGYLLGDTKTGLIHVKSPRFI